MKVKVKSLSCVRLFGPHGLYNSWNSPGQNTEVGSRSLFQGIFQTQESNQVPSIVGRFFTNWATWEVRYAAAAAKSLQLYPTLCDPIDGSPPGSPIPGILQARILEWVAISFSNACKWKVKVKSLSRVRLLATPGTAAHQAPPSMGFSRQEYWSGVPLPSPIISLGALKFLEEWKGFWFCFIFWSSVIYLSV